MNIHVHVQPMIYGRQKQRIYTSIVVSKMHSNEAILFFLETGKA